MHIYYSIKFFLLGLYEFRSCYTTNPEVDGEDYIENYDAGRELAHVLTFRRFEQF
jgi:hypothetical protein